MLLDASLVAEVGAEVEVWVTKTVDPLVLVGDVGSCGVKLGIELVDDGVGLEDVDEVERAPVEDEVVRMGCIVIKDKVGSVKLAVLVAVGSVLVGVGVLPPPGLKMPEKKDSSGFCGSAVVVVGRPRAWRFTRACSTGRMYMVFLL